MLYDHIYLVKIQLQETMNIIKYSKILLFSGTQLMYALQYWSEDIIHIIWKLTAQLQR